MHDIEHKSQARPPAVERVLGSPVGQVAVARFGRTATAGAIRDVLTLLRSVRPPSASSATIPPTDEEVTAIASQSLELLERKNRPSLRRVFNLTGTVLHTNLGRAVLPESAIEAVVMAMRHPVSLEYQVSTGERGERDDHVRGLLQEITGAEDICVVNNNAAAVLLALNTLGSDRETIVSRGELIEIGGSFRLPDIMRRAQTRLVEVGTTNRTHPADFEEAIGRDTGVIMKAHTSNFIIQGFVTAVGGREMARIARCRDVPFINDLGSGTLVNLARYGIRPEPTVQDALAEGADVVMFSGDKLLGGPQCGILAGRRDLIAGIAKNPMKRALRLDKLRIAALEATLRLYLDPARLPDLLPTLGYFTRTRAAIAEQANRLLPAVQHACGPAFVVSPMETGSQIGSGALPLETLASAGLAVRPSDARARGDVVEKLAEAFRCLPIPVIGRVTDGAVVLDLRCLDCEGAFSQQLAQGIPIGAQVAR